MTKEEIMNSYDWDHVFEYARNPSNPITREVSDKTYTRDQIERVIAADDGEGDGASWIGLFKMDDGVFLFITAWCDYTGWGCREGGGCEFTNTKKEAIACLTPEDRGRLGL